MTGTALSEITVTEGKNLKHRKQEITTLLVALGCDINAF